MIKAVLLDLDDTLLQTNTDPFVQAYIDSLVASAAKQFAHCDTAQIRSALVGSVKAMSTNLDPTCTNLQIGGGWIADHLAIDQAAWSEFIAGFHAGPYLELEHIVSQVAVARSLVEMLQQSGLAVVVATNPIFTRAALDQRLRWAGVVDLNFTLVTSSETMHFTKPHPHYYEQILAMIGVEADEALMVGDNPEFDIKGASQAGLNTYWIDQGQPWPNDRPLDDARGTLAELHDRIAQGWLNDLKPRPITAEQIAPRMIGNIAALDTMVNNIPASYWHKHPDPKEWSPIEIVYHLRDSEQTVQRPRLERIIHEENPFISPPKAPFDPDTLDLRGEDPYAIFEGFWQERRVTLDLLRALPEEAWSRPARHSVFGPTTLLEMAQFTAQHDHLHINQLCQTAGKCREV